MKNLKYNVKITDFRFDCRLETCARRARFHGICVEMTGCVKQFEIVDLLMKPDIEYSMCATLTSLFHFFHFCKIVRMNRFKRRSFAAVFIGCLIIAVGNSHYNSQAQNAEPTYSAESHGEGSVIIKGAFARLAFQKSWRSGEVEGLRALARLMKNYPREERFGVTWQTLRDNRKIQVATELNTQLSQLTQVQSPVDVSFKANQKRAVRLYQQLWFPISRTDILTTAKRKGTFFEFN